MPPGGSRPRPRPLSPGSAYPSPARSISSRTTTLQQKGLRTSVLRSWESPADRLRAEVGTLLYLLDRALLSGYRFCKRPTRPDAADILPASYGANPGLRVEFQRRQSTGACMGFDLPVPDRAGLTRYKRS